MFTRATGSGTIQATTLRFRHHRFMRGGGIEFPASLDCLLGWIQKQQKPISYDASLSNSIRINSPMKLLSDFNLLTITQAEFDTIRQILYESAGVWLGDTKQTMVCSRLAKRFRQLRISRFTDYIQRLEKNDGRELQEFINSLTTNKTDFFRESTHFKFLQGLIADIEKKSVRGVTPRLRIWSSACSSGEEPYTIAITLCESIGNLQRWDFCIDASDINTEVLAKARSGVYPLLNIATLEESLKKKYFLRGRGKFEGHCAIQDHLKSMVRFYQRNLLIPPPQSRNKYDVIFCRNVLIYFDQETQQKVVRNLIQSLQPKGYLILGHSENMPWLVNYLRPLGNTIHQLA